MRPHEMHDTHRDKGERRRFRLVLPDELDGLDRRDIAKGFLDQVLADVLMQVAHKHAMLLLLHNDDNVLILQMLSTKAATVDTVCVRRSTSES